MRKTPTQTTLKQATTATNNNLHPLTRNP